MTRIDWKQATGEATILLAGVLLALAAQAWWENRVERNTAREYISYLRVEVQSNIDNLGTLVQQYDTKMQQISELVTLLRSDNPGEADARLRELFNSIVFFSGYRPATAALENILGAGGLQLLDDTELQLAVSRYAQAIDNHNMLQAEHADFFRTEFDAALSAWIPYSEINYLGDGAAVTIPGGEFEFDPASLAGSMAFENLLLRRVGLEDNAMVFADRLLSAANDLAARLETGR